MKRIKNIKNENIAHVDIITEEKGILNIYENDEVFWSSATPIQSIDMVPTGTFDELTDRALVELGSDWILIGDE